jgi:hypothetical protein
MTLKLRQIVRIAVVGLAMLMGHAIHAQAPDRIHGENSEFAHPTVKLVWAVQRGANEDTTMVVIRLVNSGNAYRTVRVDGVDPFTKDRAVLVPARDLGATADVRIPRSRFATHPSAEIHLFRSATEVQENRPALTVYYLGVPDTTPEFADAQRMEAHLAAMAAKMR